MSKDNREPQREQPDNQGTVTESTADPGAVRSIDNLTGAPVQRQTITIGDVTARQRAAQKRKE